MNKKEVQKRVSQNGIALPLDKFSWDEKTKTFSSKEYDLVIDFNDQSDCTFNTGSGCTFSTWSDCTFKTGSDCTFKTGSSCTFKTRSDCTFKTGSGCTFKTWSGCTFNTGSGCTFNTWEDCTFNGLTFPPLRFNGSRYFIEYLKPGWIKSGCIEKPLVWWQENITRCAEENGYTTTQVTEYELYIKLLSIWMKENGLDKADQKGQ